MKSSGKNVALARAVVMNLSFSSADEAFRAELRRWLASHLPPDDGAPQADHDDLAAEVARLTSWQRRLHEGGWVGVHWPQEYGGRGASVSQNYIFQEEMARARAPEIINRIGVNLVGPTLIAHGSEEQKARYLAKILSGEELWCQLFSEPGAGSDLSSLACRAEIDGDDFIVNGQKVWTSYAQFAARGILLARTDPRQPKARGISFLIVDMRSPGVTVRPLRQLTGSEEFNEVFLDNVRVPRANLVGELHGGWQIASTTLAHERGTSARQLVVHRQRLAELIELARECPPGRPAARDPVLRQRLADAVIEVNLLKLHNWRVLTGIERGRELGRESSLVKLFWSEMSQRLHETAMAILGCEGQLAADDAHATITGSWPRSYLYYRGATIWAGTSEIQRNIIARRVLGMPG